MTAASAFCAIDFGTSNSASVVAAPVSGTVGQPSSTAAIATPVASTLPVLRPATQSRPERTR